jgi:hypothetical protein
MAFENRYTFVDRLLHRLAFATWAAQLSLADFENGIFKRELADVEVSKPVFVTALPRAGTTLLLDLCAGMDEFASHCYRDMPFVLVPMLWSRFARRFRRLEPPRERAHGDGMLVDFDSPEAFEEMVWMAFWREQYRADRIDPWTADAMDPSFEDFFRSHARKIIALRQEDLSSVQMRYVSKNNLNIARLPLLHRCFPDATVLVAVREPLQHAASLLRQHKNFLKIHREDRFARRYMAGVGHFDFGENLKPVDFDNWLEGRADPDTESLSFWLEYWIAAYAFLSERSSPNVHFVCYEDLCAKPDQTLQRIADLIEVKDRDSFLGQACRIGVSKPDRGEEDPIEPQLVNRSREVYAELQSRASRL